MKDSWIHALPAVLTKDNTDLIEDMFEWLIDPCLTFVRKNCKVGVTMFALVDCCLKQLRVHQSCIETVHVQYSSFIVHQIPVDAHVTLMRNK